MKLWLLVATLLFCTLAFSQNPDQDAQQQLQDTDSAEVVYSECIVRLGYSSKTLSAGRDFGVSQYAFTPSVTYYHRSGVYAGATGSWYSQTDPAYNLTTLSVGYDGSSKDMNWGYTVSYDRLVFNPDAAGLIKNVASVYGTRNWLHFNVGLSYSFMFSDQEQASRLNPTVGWYFSIKPANTQRWLTRVSFAPTVSATFGTSNIPLSQLSGEQFTIGNGFTWEEGRKRIAEYKQEYPELYRQYLLYRRNNPEGAVDFPAYAAQRGVTVTTTATEDTKKIFGLMCWNFSLPVSFKFHQLKVGVAYNYVIPRLLPDEVYDDLSNQSYISAAISYTFSKRH